MNTKRKVKRFQGGAGYPPVDSAINKWVDENGFLIVDIKFRISTGLQRDPIEVALVIYEEAAKENA